MNKEQFLSELRNALAGLPQEASSINLFSSFTKVSSPPNSPISAGISCCTLQRQCWALPSQ